MANLFNTTTSIALGEILEPTRLMSLIQTTNLRVFGARSGDIIKEFVYRTPRLPIFLWAKDIKTFINFPIAPEAINISKKPRFEKISIPGYHTSVPIYSGMEEKTISFEAYFDRSANSAFTDNGTGQILTHIPGYGCLDVIASFESLIYPMDKPRGSQTSVKISDVFSGAAEAFLDVTRARGYSDPNDTDFYVSVSSDTSVVGAASNAASQVNVLTQQRLQKVITDYNFYPNPVCYFFAGARFWKCIMQDLSITEVRYNKMYIPTHIKVSVNLFVLEEDSVFKEGPSADVIRSDGFYTMEKQQRDFFATTGTKMSIADQISYVISTVT